MRHVRYVICFILIFCCISSTVVYADSSCTDWNTVTINQKGVGRDSGCTTCTLELILQNSQTLKSEYQLSGNIATATEGWTKFDSAATFHSGDAWILSSFCSGADSLSNATWSTVRSVDGQSLDTADYNSMTAITGLGNKDFKDMSYEEQVTAMKVFWNAGYFVTFCVEYKGNQVQNNGPSAKYGANHATMLAGVDDTDIYINDPATGSIRLYKDCSSGGYPYNLMYVVLFKNDKTSPNTLSSSGNASVTSADSSNASSLGISENMVMGYYTEDQLSSYLKLSEINISEMFLDNATRENLSQKEISGLTNWERNISNSKEENGFIKILRIITMFVGIAMVIYGMLIYIAYWFDKINTLIAFEMLGLITFGKLHIAGDEDTSTYNLSKEGQKTIRHKDAIFISITAIFFGVLLISGFFYKIVSIFVNFILGLLY